MFTTHVSPEAYLAELALILSSKIRKFPDHACTGMGFTRDRSPLYGAYGY